jgi:hypothetical protein
MANVFLVVRPYNDDAYDRVLVAIVAHALGRAGFDFIEAHPLGVEPALKRFGLERFLGIVLTGEGFGTDIKYLTRLAAQLPTAVVVWEKFLSMPNAEWFKNAGVKFLVEYENEAIKLGIDWIGDPATYVRLIEPRLKVTQIGEAV